MLTREDVGELGLVKPHVGIAVLWPPSRSIVGPKAVDCITVSAGQGWDS